MKDEAHCRNLVERTVEQLGSLDILVDNAAHQRSFEKIEGISAEEWDLTFRTNIYSMFYLCRAAVPHLKPGSAIINTSSINATSPSPHLLAHATTKGAMANFTAGLGQLLAEKGIRVNAVAPGPTWTPLIPSTMPPEAVEKFRKNTPLGRPGQPAELAGAYVNLAIGTSIGEGAKSTQGAEAVLRHIQNDLGRVCAVANPSESLAHQGVAHASGPTSWRHVHHALGNSGLPYG